MDSLINRVRGFHGFWPKCSLIINSLKCGSGHFDISNTFFLSPLVSYDEHRQILAGFEVRELFAD